MNDFEFLDKAKTKAIISKRPVYIVDGEILDKKPHVGKYLVVWPNGSIVACNLSRRRKRKKNSEKKEKAI